MNERLGQTRSPTMAEVLKAAVAQGLADTHVALPGVVTKYNATTQRADVKPTVQLPYINDDGSEGTDVLPVIPEVPVLWPRAGGFFLHLPMVAGDTVLLLICERSIDEWNLTSGKVDTDPKDFRKHDLSDAIAIPGLATVPGALSEVLTGGAVFGEEKGTQVRAKSSAVEVTSNGLPSSTGGFVALASKVDALWLAINTVLVGWTAPKTPDGGVALALALTTAIVASGAFQATAASNLKADL
jgi:hypothetical protein